MILSVKTKIAEKLTGAFENLEDGEKYAIPVETPSSLVDYIPKHSIGAYVIVFESAKFSDNDRDTAVEQVGTLNFEVIVSVKKRPDTPDPVWYLERAIEALTGTIIETPVINLPIIIGAIRFLDEIDNTWNYTISVIAPASILAAEQ